MRALVGPVLLALLAAPTLSDVVYVGGKGRLKCAVVRESEEEIVVNTFNSRHPEAINGAETFLKSRVKKVVREVDALRESRRRAAEAKTIEDLLALAAYCKEHKLEPERQRTLLRAFVLDRENADVRKAITPTKAERLVRAEPGLNPELAKALEIYLETEDVGERKKARGKLGSTFGYAPGDLYLERAWRSARAGRGQQVDRPLTLRARDIKAVYTLLVPKDYDATRPYPLVIGLHGGGPGGKERDKVVGSGRAAMQKYGRESARRGWIAACPTAVVAGWGSKSNRELVTTLIEELGILYNVDRNRIYLVGHSMGGYGTFALGPAFAETWAAIAPMSGGGGGGSMKKLMDTGTGIYIYHSADDNVCGVGGSRGPAERLRSLEADFVYTEVNGAGHGIARGVIRDIFDYFAVRTLAKGRSRRFSPTRAPDSSFSAKTSRDEKTYFGDPLHATPSGGTSDTNRWKDLISDLRKGGGSADRAAAELIALASPKSRKPLGDIAGQPKWDADVRAAACRVLARIGNDASVTSLARALRAEQAVVRDAAAKALGVLGSAKGLKPLLASLQAEWTVFDGKRIGGTHFHYSDWEVLLRSFAIRAAALAELGDATAAKAIHRIVVKKVLGGGWQVHASARAGQDARRPVRACGVAVAESLGTLGGADAAKALRDLKAAVPEDGKVQSACDAALARIG